MVEIETGRNIYHEIHDIRIKKRILCNDYERLHVLLFKRWVELEGLKKELSKKLANVTIRLPIDGNVENGYADYFAEDDVLSIIDEVLAEPKEKTK